MEVYKKIDIDYTIAKYKEKSEFYKGTTNVAYGLELEQVAEWLEELKALKSASELWEHNNNLAYKQGRIDAIDEFMKVMEEWDKRVGFIRDECAFFTISNIRDAAEQIKAR